MPGRTASAFRVEHSHLFTVCQLQCETYSKIAEHCSDNRQSSISSCSTHCMSLRLHAEAAKHCRARLQRGR
eukprot:16814-Heterococcus_DN1.PRE.1